jgi:hypothetical protein
VGETFGEEVQEEGDAEEHEEVVLGGRDKREEVVARLGAIGGELA